MAGKKKKRERVLLPEVGGHPERKPTVLWEAMGKSPNLPEESGKQTQRRSFVVAEEAKTKAEWIDFTGMAKVWKEAYLGGLEASLNWQKQNEIVAKSLIHQGLTATQQCLTLYKNVVDTSLEQIPAQANAIPVLALSRHMIQSAQAAAEPAFKTGAEVCETSFSAYETALAGPSRKYMLEVNKRVMDTIVPS